MVVEISLSDEQIRLLEQECEHKGLEIQQLVQELTAKEALRLWHIERCRPKPKQTKPPGPQPLSPAQRQIRELSRLLFDVYRRRKGQLGEVFEETLGGQLREIEAAVQQEDLGTLEKYFREKPWMKKWDS